jgi:peptidoglycan/LPS O-acetylase OafA/YrhL
VTGRRPRLDALTSLRFVAAAMIVVFHAVDGISLPSSTSTWLPYGLASGVSFFFVLSGFILYYNYPRLPDLSSVLDFYAARVARVWPLHLLSMALFLALVPSVLWVWPGLHLWIAAPLSALLLQAWSPIGGYMGAFNGPAWTLSVEAFFYLLFPLLLVAMRKAPWRALGAAFLLSLACPLVANRLGGPRSDLPLDQVNWYHLDHTFPLARLTEFVLGMTTCRLWLARRAQAEASPLAATALEAAALLATLTAIRWLFRAQYAVLLGTGAGVADWLTQVSAAPIYALLIYAVADGRGRLSRALSAPGLVHLGEVSYGVYILHMIVIIACRSMRLTPKLAALDWRAALLIMICIVAGVSHLAWRFVEMPARRALLRACRKRDGVPALPVVVPA